MNLIDFLIGFFLMNAMPHLLCGLFEIRMLSVFGFSRAANLGYAAFNTTAALLLFHIQYGIAALWQHGIMLGAGTILLAYVLTGRYFFVRFNK